MKKEDIVQTPEDRIIYDTAKLGVYLGLIYGFIVGSIIVGGLVYLFL